MRASRGRICALDPSGGGTTLFTALMLGAEAAGVEQGDQDIKSTAAFVRQFAREQRIRVKEKQERLRKLGWRWTFELGPAPGRRCVLALGNTQDSAALIAGFKPHLIVADLPYGIQHSRPLIDLLGGGLPVWASLLPVGGCLVMAWMQRASAAGRWSDSCPPRRRWTCWSAAPMTLAHRVDRVIKQRDVLVARRK